MAGGHDQLFKDLISAFRNDLLRLMAPALVARLDSSFEPQPTETFLDLPRGAARRPDALMRWPPSVSQAERYLACIQRIARARGLTDAQRFLLVNCVTTFLQLGHRPTPQRRALSRDGAELRILPVEAR